MWLCAHLGAGRTLDEKVAQLTYAGSVSNASIASAVRAGGVGGLQCPDVPANCVPLINRLQYKDVVCFPPLYLLFFVCFLLRFSLPAAIPGVKREQDLHEPRQPAVS